MLYSISSLCCPYGVYGASFIALTAVIDEDETRNFYDTKIWLSTYPNYYVASLFT